jgi:hypothetical protein
MTIQRLQITARTEEYDLKLLFPPGTKELNKREVREKAAELFEWLAPRLRAGRTPDTDGGQSGFWRDGRVEEIVVSKGKVKK